jgi:uncharacterized membrane protein
VYHHVIASDSKFIPKFCRMDGNSCELILHTRDAALFGIPNFYLGFVFYLALFFLSFSPSILLSLRVVVLIVSAVPVVVGFYLAYSLLYKLKVNCVLCFTSHAMNLIIFLILLLL